MGIICKFEIPGSYVGQYLFHQDLLGGVGAVRNMAAIRAVGAIWAAAFGAVRVIGAAGDTACHMAFICPRLYV